MSDKLVTFTKDFDFRWPGVPKVTAYKAGRTHAVSPMVYSAAMKAGAARRVPIVKPDPPPETETETEADNGE